jgi:hypothetical protein
MVSKTANLCSRLQCLVKKVAFPVAGIPVAGIPVAGIPVAGIPVAGHPGGQQLSHAGRIVD